MKVTESQRDRETGRHKHADKLTYRKHKHTPRQTYIQTGTARETYRLTYRQKDRDTY